MPRYMAKKADFAAKPLKYAHIGRDFCSSAQTNTPQITPLSITGWVNHSHFFLEAYAIPLKGTPCAPPVI